MKFEVLAALLGATSAIKINQSTGGFQQCTTAPTEGPPATLQCPTPLYSQWIVQGTACAWACEPLTQQASGTDGPPMPPAGSPIGQQCTTAPTAGPPATLQCATGDIQEWIVMTATGDCAWTCMPNTTGTGPMPPTTAGTGQMGAPPQPPSKADQIQDFASGFFEQCDKNGDSYMTKHEMKQCLRHMMRESRRGMKSMLKQQIQQNQNSIEMQKEQMKEQLRSTRSMMKDIGSYIFEGASNQTGADAKKGITQTEVVAFLTNDGWAEVQSMMNEGPGGDSGSGDSGSGDNGYGDSGSGDSGAPQYQNVTAPGNSTTCATGQC